METNCQKNGFQSQIFNSRPHYIGKGKVCTCVVISARHFIFRLQDTASMLHTSSSSSFFQTATMWDHTDTAVNTHTLTHCSFILVRTRTYIIILLFVSIFDFCSPCNNHHGRLDIKKSIIYLSWFLFSQDVASSRPTSDSLRNVSIIRWITLD